MGDEDSKASMKQGASIGGWCCFAIGMAIMFYSVWMFFFYIPFFFVSFVLAITAMAQRRIASGIALMLALLIVPGVTWLVLSATRMNSFVLDVDRKLAEAEAAGMGKIRLLPAIGSSAPPPAPSAASQTAAPQAEPAPGNTTTAPDAPSQRGAAAPAAGGIPAPAAAAKPNEPWYRVPAESLESLHAWELQLGPSRLFTDPAISLNMPPAFSPDMTLVAVLREVNFQPAQVLLMRLDTHEVVESWTPAQQPSHIAWSGDGRRLAYLIRYSDEAFGVYDRGKGEEVQVPLPSKLSLGTSGLAWDGDAQLVHRARGRLEAIDLDSLKITQLLPEDVKDEVLDQAWEQLLAKNGRRHPHAYLKVSGDWQEGTADIFVTERDNTFQKAIFGPVSGGARVYCSPDLRHAIFHAGDALMHALMIRSEPSILAFDLNLAIRETVGQENWPDIKQHLESSRTIWGNVYGPLINPLNGKVTGADRKNYRGVVQFIRWTSAKAGVQTVSEKLPIRVGDVVVEIDHRRMGFSTVLGTALKDRWYALQLPGDDRGEASPATASPATASPATASPATASPTTASPATASPATASPTTASPTTASPTTASPTPRKTLPPRPSTKSNTSSREMTSEEFLRKAKALQKR